MDDNDYLRPGEENKKPGVKRRLIAARKMIPPKIRLIEECSEHLYPGEEHYEDSVKRRLIISRMPSVELHRRLDAEDAQQNKLRGYTAGGPPPCGPSAGSGKRR